MQNSNTTFEAVRTPTQLSPSQDSDEFKATLVLISGRLSLKSLNFVIKKHNEDDKIKLITQFLQVGEVGENITCKDFAEMVTSLEITDEDKKMKLITEFLGSNKVLITSIKTHSFAESLNISDKLAKETLSLIKDAFIEKNIGAFHQIFNLFQPIFESEGLRANIVENFIINSQRNPISQDEVNRYLIQGFSITNPTYINKINHALQEIYPTQSPVQSIAGSQAGAPETEPTPEEIKQLRAALQFESTDSSASSQLSAREERLLQFLNGQSSSEEEKKLRERIEKWLNNELATNPTSSSQTQHSTQQNFQPQEINSSAELSVTASLVLQGAQPNSQTTTLVLQGAQPNSQTTANASQEQRLSSLPDNCCIVS